MRIMSACHGFTGPTTTSPPQLAGHGGLVDIIHRDANRGPARLFATHSIPFQLDLHLDHPCLHTRAMSLFSRHVSIIRASHVVSTQLYSARRKQSILNRPTSALGPRLLSSCSISTRRLRWKQARSFAFRHLIDKGLLRQQPLLSFADWQQSFPSRPATDDLIRPLDPPASPSVLAPRGSCTERF